MELYILNRNLELKGILDTFKSLIWIKKYNKTGQFELHCSLNSNTLKLLQRENIIFKKDDLEAAYIETRQLRIDNNGQEYLQLTGKFLTNYLDRRISWNRIDFTGTTEKLMRKLIHDNAINPDNENRKIPNLILGDLKNFTENIKYQNSFGNILEQLENISNTSVLGYRNLLDIKNRKIIFDVYKGIDRTINTGAEPCIFSRDFENILEQNYYDSLNNYRNTCLIAGGGEGKDRTLTSIEEGKGLNRYELYVDARDIQATKEIKKGDTTEEIPIPVDEYLHILKQRGKERLEEYKEIQTFDSKINIDGNNKYKKDFDLGDIVTVVDKKWEIQLNAMITEIEEIYEEKGLEINIIFGNNIPNLIDKIKQKTR
ncbi:siphovirus ReqiPepy6 Gp37-like family protein [Hathewaya limosa]|uniref:Gp28/Gp37-like domain-containing protein n=1 Tax=Hathewaya limosa TaxID=1536 RepID=A0ABU0JRM8_HATLI|nr:siphovirus ReqiPepy6 Gp37-like family protein [Hathewaya limosa]MDQ0479714.1 hypothetical protein [Hathewaya limosa]